MLHRWNCVVHSIKAFVQSLNELIPRFKRNKPVFGSLTNEFGDRLKTSRIDTKHYSNRSKGYCLLN